MPDEWFEDICAAIACDVLGGGARWERRDVPGANHMRDFDIVFADGRREALEVCAFTDPVVEANRAARAGNDALRSGVLSRTWLVAAPPDAVVKGLLAAAEPALREFERRGREEFHACDWSLMLQTSSDDGLRAAAGILLERGVEDALSCAPADEQGPIVLLTSMTGGVLDSEDINRAVENRTHADDNQAKLSAAHEAAARHLFVPIRMSTALTFAAATYGPPRCAPHLPGVVTRAWVFATRPEVMWVEPPSGWQSASFDPLTLDEPERWRR